MNNKKSKIVLPLLVFVAFIGGAIWSYLVINQLNKGSTVTTGRTGNYTINENSISSAVDKVYDATVVVATYKDGKAVSTGTGFVYKTEGSTAYIMTNNHVVDGADKSNDKKVVIMFVGSSVIGLIFNQILMYLFVSILGIFYMVAKIITTAIVMVWNYVMKKMALVRK